MQTFAAEEAEDGSVVVVSEEASEEAAEEAEAVTEEDAPAASDEKKEEPAAAEEPEAKPESVPEETEAVEEAAPAEVSEGSIAYECDEYTVVLEYGKDAGIPAGTALEVREILADSKDKKEKEEYEKYHDEALEALKKERAEDTSVSEDIASFGFARFFDITLISDGKEIEPTGDVSVRITFNKDARETVGKTENAENDLRVVHITENENSGKLEAAALEKKDTEMSIDKKELSEASFKTDSFSVYGIVYTVDFEYEGYAFSIEGESEILISDLFERLHIEEDASKVENVEFTDYELIKVEQTEGDWKLISLKPFDTEEKLTVTLEDKIIEIKVTDAQSGNTFLFRKSRWLTSELFRVTVYAKHSDSNQRTLIGDDDDPVEYTGSNGWMGIDDMINYYDASLLNSTEGSNKARYSVASAKDSGISSQPELGAVGFQQSFIGHHGACGLFLSGNDGNSSTIEYDVEVTLNDNSIPVIVYENGVDSPVEYYVDNTKKTYTAKELAEVLGHEVGGAGYAIASAKVGDDETGSVSVDKYNGTSLGGRKYVNAGRIATGGFIFDAFNHQYGDVYRWTYKKGSNTVGVGDGPYEIRLETPVARVSNDGVNWTYHAKLIDSGVQDGVTKIGAFDQANSLSGDVVVEMLYDTHARYTLDRGFTFNNANISSLTIKGTSNKTTLVKDQTTATIVPMITTTKIGTVSFNDIIFNGNNNATSNNYGGAVLTDAGTLSVSNCKFINCQAGVPGDAKGQGGGFCHQNTNGTVTINNCVFDHCKASGNNDNQGAGGGGFFTNALNLSVKDTVFEGCTTYRYQGAGFFHKRKGETKASKTEVTDCKFNNCVSVWSGGGMESDARTVIVTGTEFYGCQATHADGGKGGAINVWANGENNTTNESSLLVSDCIFGAEENGTGCTANDNGGAVRSTAKNTTIENSTFTNCSATKSGGAVAYTNDKAESTVEIKGCSFSGCTAGQNGGAYFSVAKSNTTIDKLSDKKTEIDGCSAKVGGAIWSGILNVNDATISNCSATTGNGGAIHGEAAVTMIAGTISSCSATGNGGAIDGNTTVTVNGGSISSCSATENGGAINGNTTVTVNGGSINNCSANANGGAIYSAKTITMTGGTVTNNTTRGESAAVDAAEAKPGIYLEGNVVVKDNTGSEGEARDVYIGIDSDRHIQINTPGLGDNASIGIYVANGNNAFNKHGKPGQMFARTGNGNTDGSGGTPAASMRNLDKLFSDRLDNGPMYGAAATTGQYHEYRVMWSDETPVAPTGYNSKYIPFILILIGGAVLVMLKKTADRRRRSEDDSSDEEE